MRLHRFEQTQILPVSPQEAWDFFSVPENLDSITPDDLGFHTTSPPEGPIYEGRILTHRIRIAPLIHVDWVTEIKAVDPGRSFVDEQRAGPYRMWHHRHLLEACPEGTRVNDLVHYALPFGPCGAIAHTLFVRSKIASIFATRRHMLEKHFGKA